LGYFCSLCVIHKWIIPIYKESSFQNIKIETSKGKESNPTSMLELNHDVACTFGNEYGSKYVHNHKHEKNISGIQGFKGLKPWFVRTNIFM